MVRSDLELIKIFADCYRCLDQFIGLVDEDDYEVGEYRLYVRNLLVDSQQVLDTLEFCLKEYRGDIHCPRV